MRMTGVGPADRRQVMSNVRHLAEPPALKNSDRSFCSTANPCSCNASTKVEVAEPTMTVRPRPTALHAKASASASLQAMRLDSGIRASIDASESALKAFG